MTFDNARRYSATVEITPPPPEPYRLPGDICHKCFETDFPVELANTFCYDIDWIILGYDDYYGEKNPDDQRNYYQNTEGKYIRYPPSAPPRFFWAKGMWGIQIRLYKDLNA